MGVAREASVKAFSLEMQLKVGGLVRSGRRRVLDLRRVKGCSQSRPLHGVT